ncbi:MAG TPA: hypothetical protein PLN68_04250 [Elusimicrobiales bacterium]|nr:hypothetical protein [Elusimicrobiales bacterium]
MKIKPLNDLNLIDFVREIKKTEAYLVGGCVRDWYLGKKCFDIDITFSDYPLDIARKVAQKFDLKLEEFKKFLTIRLLSKERRIDFATFRKEKYLRPASLPEVEKAVSIEEDLKRRDFTINAVALSINEDLYQITDPFNGIDDINKGVIRVLHENSFADDPTRIFRAVRFSNRFGWKIEKETLKLIEKHKNYVSDLSKERIRNEIIKILSEEKCFQALKKIEELDIIPRDMFFGFDAEIDNFKTLEKRYDYIFQKNGIGFFERYNFERKIKKSLGK